MKQICWQVPLLQRICNGYWLQMTKKHWQQELARLCAFLRSGTCTKWQNLSPYRSPNGFLSHLANVVLRINNELKEDSRCLVCPDICNESVALWIVWSNREMVTFRILSLEGSTFLSAFDGYLDDSVHSLHLTTNELPKGMHQIEISTTNMKSYLKW